MTITIPLLLAALLVQTLLILAALLIGAWVQHRAAGRASPFPDLLSPIAEAVRKSRRPADAPPKPGPDIRG